MKNFWHGKTLHTVVKEYLSAAVDELANRQPMNIEGIAKELCENITIKSNINHFVADYFDDAIDTVIETQPDSDFRYSQYDKITNMMLMRAAIDVLHECPTALQYDGTYHIWKQGDIEALRDDLYVDEDEIDANFQRACDINFESLESYTFRYLDFALPKLIGTEIDLKDLALEMPLAVLSDADARSFLKSNFSDSMKLLDQFRDSGFKVNYASPSEMMQNIIYQKEKDILSTNPYLIDIIEYDGISKITVDRDFVDDLRESLKEQSQNIKMAKFAEIQTDRPYKTFNRSSDDMTARRNNNGQVIDLRKSQNRIEILH